MSLITELTAESSEFLLGRVLSRDPETAVELERFVSSSDQVMPYLWVGERELPEFESRVRTSPHVARLVALDVVNNQGMYRIEWTDDGESLVYGLAEVGATVLEAKGNETWTFHLRFDAYGDLARFHNYCRRRGIGVSVDRVYSPDNLGEKTEIRAELER